MLGPYSTNKTGTIKYKGNKIFPAIENVSQIKISLSDIENRVQQLHDNMMWSSISKINNTINTTITNFFNSIGALFVPLPLTTRMISSPGAVYGKQKIDYTTDGGASWMNITENATGLHHDWNVPPYPSPRCLAKIHQKKLPDISEFPVNLISFFKSVSLCKKIFEF